MIARNSGIGCKACLNKSVHGRHRRIEQRDRHSQLGGLDGNAFHGFIQISNAKNDQGARLRVSTDQDQSARYCDSGPVRSNSASQQNIFKKAEGIGHYEGRR